MPDQGDIVLIPVPFTDLSSQKRRPVIVISNNSYNRQSADILVVAMTSRATVSRTPFKFPPPTSSKRALNRPGTARVDKVYSLATAIVIKRFGKVTPQVVEWIRRLIDSLISPVPSIFS